MNETMKRKLVTILLERHGRAHSEELGIKIGRNTPSALFRWLMASLLLSARIRADVAIRAARALSDQGWTTAARMAKSTWEQRTRVLNEAGYARYDESTSRMLEDTTHMLLEHYRGDLRKLREAAGRDPAAERTLLKEFKGIGDVGVDIFFREVQTAWGELRPFADAKALGAARRVGLRDDAAALAALVNQEDLPRLLAALVRADLAKDLDAVAKAASAG